MACSANWVLGCAATAKRSPAAAARNGIGSFATLLDNADALSARLSRSSASIPIRHGLGLCAEFPVTGDRDAPEACIFQTSGRMASIVNGA